jgi:hypothetical protein
VEEIPKGGTGKVQRTTLHEKLGASLHRPYVAPRSELERAVEAVFRDVLECGALGVHDNFFGLGGDSLKGARLIARINAEHGLDLPAVTVFRHPDIAQIAASIERARTLLRAEEAALSAEIEALSDEEVKRLLRESDEQPRR